MTELIDKFEAQIKYRADHQSVFMSVKDMKRIIDILYRVNSLNPKRGKTK